MTHRMIFIPLLLLSALAVAQVSGPSLPTDPVLKDEPAPGIPEGLIQFGTGTEPTHAFVVDKAARALSIWQVQGDQVQRVAHVPTDIGANGGDKKENGDKKTPEGIYFLQERLQDGQLDFNLYGSRAFTSNYPNFFDRRAGKTGSGIWLHAIPDTVPLTRGSRGCVVVRNHMIQEITKYIQLGQTPLLIYDNVHYISAKDAKKQREQTLDFIEKWRAAWESLKVDDYMNYYDSSFRSMGMDRDRWKIYKTGLAQKYGFIKLRFSDISAFQHKDEILVRAVQHYTSDRYTDFGEKTLYLKKTAEGLKIVGEEWKALKGNLAAAAAN